MIDDSDCAAVDIDVFQQTSCRDRVDGQPPCDSLRVCLAARVTRKLKARGAVPR